MFRNMHALYMHGSDSRNGGQGRPILSYILKLKEVFKSAGLLRIENLQLLTLLILLTYNNMHMLKYFNA